MNDLQWSAVQFHLERILASPRSKWASLVETLPPDDPDVAAEVSHLLSNQHDGALYLERLRQRLRAGIAEARHRLEEQIPSSG